MKSDRLQWRRRRPLRADDARRIWESAQAVQDIAIGVARLASSNSQLGNLADQLIAETERQKGPLESLSSPIGWSSAFERVSAGAHKLPFNLAGRTLVWLGGSGLHWLHWPHWPHWRNQHFRRPQSANSYSRQPTQARRFNSSLTPSSTAGAARWRPLRPRARAWRLGSGFGAGLSVGWMACLLVGAICLRARSSERSKAKQSKAKLS